MILTIAQWHQRYLQQARWTQNLREYLFQKCGIRQATKILDVGCGTGVLETELSEVSSAHSFGIEIVFESAMFSHTYAPKSIYTVGDGLSLPYQIASFDVTLCHFLLLWIDHAQAAINEMVRVTKPNGYVMALAEPDYGGRIDFPPELSQIGSWQTEALKEQGANPFIGRQLRSIFSKAGLVDIEVGILGAQWGQDISDQDIELEWQVLLSDLINNQEFMLQADDIKSLEISSRRALQRILFVPVFYAFGLVRS